MIPSVQSKITTQPLVLATETRRFLTIPAQANTMFSTASHWHFTLPENERKRKVQRCKIQKINAPTKGVQARRSLQKCQSLFAESSGC